MEEAARRYSIFCELASSDILCAGSEGCRDTLSIHGTPHSAAVPCTSLQRAAAPARLSSQCSMLNLLAFVLGYTANGLGPPAQAAIARPHVAMIYGEPRPELCAMLLACPHEEAMLPGDVGWMKLMDDQRALVVQAARKPPFNGLLAQQLLPSCTVVPLLKLCATRRPDRAGMLVEACCVGRGLVHSVGGGRMAWASVSVYNDRSEELECCDEAVQTIRRLIAEMRGMAATLDGVSSSSRARFASLGSSAPGDARECGLRALLRSSTDEHIASRQSALRRRGHAANTDSITSDVAVAELLSYAACQCLAPNDRLRAVEVSSTHTRLLLCIEQLRERHGLLSARMAVQQALS